MNFENQKPKKDYYYTWVVIIIVLHIPVSGNKHHDRSKNVQFNRKTRERKHSELIWAKKQMAY